MNLRTKISFTVSLMVAGIVAALGVFTHVFYERQFKALIVSSHDSTISLLAHDIDSTLETAQRQLIAAAGRVTPEMLQDAEIAQQFLDSRGALLEVFDNHIGLFTVKGIEVTESPLIRERRGRDFSRRPYIRDTVAKDAPVITEPYISSQAHGHPAVVMSAPVYGPQGPMIGILIGSLDLMRPNILGNISQHKFGRRGYLYLTTADRTVIIHPEQDRIFRKIEPGANTLYDRVVNEGFEGTDSVVGADGVEMIATFRRLNKNNWILAANYPASEAFAPVHAASRYFLGGAVIGTALIFGLAWLLMSRITANLGLLTRHVSGLAGREGPDRMLSIATPDEIGTLSRAFNAMVQDLDERQHQLEESMQKYAALVETTDTGFVILDDTGRVLDANDEYVRMSGHRNQREILGRSVIEWTAEHEKERNAAEVKKCIERGSVRNLVIEYGGQEGRITPVEINATVVKTKAGMRIFTLCRDISDRRAAERALRESERRFRETLENIALIAVQLDSLGTITFANKYLAELTGWDMQEIIGRNWMEQFVPPNARDRIRDLHADNLTHGGTSQPYENEIVTRAGQRRLVSWTNSQMLDADGSVVGVTSIGLDITEHRQIEEQMRQIQRLESIGTLAGGIAHDFNNLLQGIFGYLSLARMHVNDPGKALAMLEQVERALHLSVNLTSQLLTFSKGGKPAVKPVSLPLLVEDAARFALSGAKSGHRLVIDDRLWPVLADESQISQVIQNIVLNADQAMPLGGTIEIEASNVESPGADVPAVLGTGRFVRITIRDRGVGIPREYLPRIFDPFFTTKEKGSGLGLSTSFSIVRNHGGLINVSSDPGRGSTFTIYLPAATAVPEDEPSPPAPEPARQARILVMDDEEMIRDIASKMIATLGHIVKVACSGDEAISLYQEAQRAGVPFDLVILDLTIRGGMGGLKALEKLREIDPHVKAVVSSGYSDDAAMADHQAAGFAGVLKKPYATERLREVLSEVLR